MWLGYEELTAVAPSPSRPDEMTWQQAVVLALADSPWWAPPVLVLVGILLALVLLWLVWWRISAAIRRYRATLEERATSDRTRQQRIGALRSQVTTDRLVVVQFAVAMGFSATGMAHSIEHYAGIPVPLNWLGFLVFEGFALTIMAQINQRAHQDLPAGGLRVLYWVVIGAAAVGGASHADTWGGRAFYAGFTIVAGLSYELRMMSKRKARDQELRAAGEQAARRHLSWIGWLNMAERVRVLRELAADEELGAAEATARVRARVAEERGRVVLERAEAALRELRLVQLSVEAIAASGWRRRRLERRLGRARVRAERALATAGVAGDPEQFVTLVRGLQLMLAAPRLASLGERSGPEEARQVWEGLFAVEDLAAVTVRGVDAVGGGVVDEGDGWVPPTTGEVWERFAPSPARVSVVVSEPVGVAGVLEPVDGSLADVAGVGAAASSGGDAGAVSSSTDGADGWGVLDDDPVTTVVTSADGSRVEVTVDADDPLMEEALATTAVTAAGAGGDDGTASSGGDDRRPEVGVQSSAEAGGVVGGGDDSGARARWSAPVEEDDDAKLARIHALVVSGALRLWQTREQRAQGVPADRPTQKSVRVAVAPCSQERAKALRDAYPAFAARVRGEEAPRGEGGLRGPDGFVLPPGVRVKRVKDGGGDAP
ncbi:hypothetical protein ACFVWN_01460 [Nocardiopsis flavescens]|uniref:hypothetical protein n=1 Tax=Nocardiopsis flavescens TaxID=758803 RepID=UPI00365816C8